MSKRNIQRNPRSGRNQGNAGQTGNSARGSTSRNAVNRRSSDTNSAKRSQKSDRRNETDPLSSQTRPTLAELQRIEREVSDEITAELNADVPSFLRRYARGEVETETMNFEDDESQRYAGYADYETAGVEPPSTKKSGKSSVDTTIPHKKTVAKVAAKSPTTPKSSHAAGKRSNSTGAISDTATNVKPATKRKNATDEDAPGRLQKVLAAAGLGSRRQCEELITTGRVEIDRQVVTELGTRVDPFSQEIRVDGMILPQQKREYYALHKPKGFVTTSRDPSGRPRVIDLIPSEGKHLFAVGRLDMSSEGLILVTNDGDWAERITHPRYGVEKIYRVTVSGEPERSTLAQLERGVYLAEGLAKVKKVIFKKRVKNQSILEMILDEGKNREIRRVLAKVGHKVQRLVRIAVGPIRLGDMPLGAYRPLTKDEIQSVIDEVSQNRRERKSAGTEPRTPTDHKTSRPRWTGRAVQFSDLREVKEDEARQREQMEAEEAKQRRINAGRAGQRRGRSTGDRITGKSSINTPRGRSSMTENTESRSTAGRSGSSRTGGHTGSRSTSRSTGRSGNSHSSGRNARSDSQNTGRRGAARFTNGRKRGK